jgi:uncharacterized membrane protein YbhN (UPF0104 family)
MPRSSTPARGPASRPGRRPPSRAGRTRARRPIAAPARPKPPPPGSLKPTLKPRRRALVLAILAILAGAAVAGAAPVADIGGRLATGRPAWILSAAGLELVSALGFVVIFQLVFCECLPTRLSLRMGLAVRAATILVPAGGLIAIGLGARALRQRGMRGTNTGSRAVAFLVITNAPNLIVLGLLGIALGAGLIEGPHAPILTIVPAAIALGAIGLTILLPIVSHRRAARAPLRLPRRLVFAAARQLELGVVEARALLVGRSWKLLGAVAYYAADNAVLWAMFKAFGHTDPPIAIFVMAYLIGSAAGSLPVPAGIGVVDGGMIGTLALYGAPATCAGIAVLAYRAVSTGLPLALGGVAFLRLCRLPAPPAASTAIPNASP